MLLLDTHVWVWSTEDDRRLGRRARQLIGRADARSELRISAASVFEIAALHVAGRLRLRTPAERWIRESLEQPGVGLAELTISAAMDAGAIPRNLLPDPIDRLLVATARQMDATFLTADGRILDHAERTGSVRVHDAGM